MFDRFREIRLNFEYRPASIPLRLDHRLTGNDQTAQPFAPKLMFMRLGAGRGNRTPKVPSTGGF